MSLHPSILRNQRIGTCWIQIGQFTKYANDENPKYQT